MELKEHLERAREKAAEVNKGNTHSSKNNRLWADTLKRALMQADGNKIRAIAEALIEKAASGDVSYITFPISFRFAYFDIE